VLAAFKNSKIENVYKFKVALFTQNFKWINKHPNNIPENPYSSLWDTYPKYQICPNLNFHRPKANDNYGTSPFGFVWSKLWETIPINLKKTPSRPVYTGDFCRSNSMQFLSRSKLQLQYCTCKPGAIFTAICRHDIAGASYMFETWCNFSATKIASWCRDKNRLCKRAFALPCTININFWTLSTALTCLNVYSIYIAYLCYATLLCFYCSCV